MDRPWRLARREATGWGMLLPHLYKFEDVRGAERLAARYRKVDPANDYRAAKLGTDGKLCAIAPRGLRRK